MRSLKTFTVLLMALGLLVYGAGSSPLLADENDAPHQTHLTHLRGPGIGLGTDNPPVMARVGEGCTACHTSATPVYNDVNWDICNVCHSPGGVYDGVNDSVVGAINNWENVGPPGVGDPAGASQSLIYDDTDVTLKEEKEKWCGTCHDESAGAVIDDFEGYADSADLQTTWKQGADTYGRTLEPHYFIDDNYYKDFDDVVSHMNWEAVYNLSAIRGQYMKVVLDSARSTNAYGNIRRDFNPPLDLSGMDSINLYLKVSNKSNLTKIRVRLRNTDTWSWSQEFVTAKYGYNNNVWKMISLPRSSFTITTDAHWQSIDRINIRIFDKASTTVWLDEIGCNSTVPNVVGDDQNWGCYKTGHGFCTYCHDPGSEHIDANQRNLFDYIQINTNPTNFRFYADSNKQMVLPYNDQWVTGPGGSFALCHQCHEESNFMTNGDAEDLVGITNFSDLGYIPFYPDKSDNLHYIHLSLTPIVFNMTCVACHDPHGQSNLAMTRYEMGDLFYFDFDGCKITDQADWHNPDVNRGAAQRTKYYGPLCTDVCHNDVVPPNEPPCNPGDDPYEYYDLGVNGFYVRDYQYVPHGGGPCGDCHEGHGLESGSHATHTQENPKGPDPLPCSQCHGEEWETGTECNICHTGGGEPVVPEGWISHVADMNCDACHSPGGAFDGVSHATIGAKVNWAGGIYEADGTTLRSGKEQWCGGCHDDNPNTPENESALIDGAYAPNIAGDENNGNTYGFNLTGHGVDLRTGHKINCLDCHDAAGDHIDGLHRTYESALDNYQAGYRLRSVGGGAPMDVPRSRNLDVYSVLDDFSLCFDCHNFNEVLGQEALDLIEPWSDVSHTNFWNDSDFVANFHSYHLEISSNNNTDSDWNGSGDSAPTCIGCHNVHGAPNQAMIRHGELLSVNRGFPPDFAALNFTYLAPPTEPAATATWTPDIASAGSYGVYAWWVTGGNRATNAPYTIYYDGGSDTVEVNQKVTDPSGWNDLGTYPFAAGTSGSVMLSNVRPGDLEVDGYVIADAIGLDTTGDGNPDLIVDNGDGAPDFELGGTWGCGVRSGSYGDDGTSCVHAKRTLLADPTASLAISLGGIMYWGGTTIPYNGVCDGSCHGSPRYEREPKLWPKVIDANAAPATVPNDGTGSVLITALVSDPDGDFDPDTGTGSLGVDLSSIGGSANQALNDDGNNGDVAADDGIYSYLAPIPDGTAEGERTLVITATDDAVPANTGTNVILLSVIEPGTVTVDNSDLTNFSTWPLSPDPDKWGCGPRDGSYKDGTSCINSPGTGSATATWTPDIPEAGNYKVYAWWVTGSNRATDAPYTIYYHGGSETVDVNQQVNGNQWNLLGTYPFVAGQSGYVVLSDDANQYVIADAVKFEP